MKLIQFEITKEYILSKVSEIDIFERYLEISSVSLNKFYTNILREDSFPKCSFYVRDTDNRLIFNDFAWRQFDCFDVVKQKYGVSFIKALEIIANDFGLIKNTKVVEARKELLSVKAKYGLRIKRKHFSKRDLDFWNIGGLDVSYKVLQDNSIFSIECYWEYVNNEQRFYDNLKCTFAYHFPDESDLFKYQIYSPLKDKHQRRFINPTGIKYGDFEFLNTEFEYVVITKSKKDAFYLRLFGINSCFIINEKIRASDVIPPLLLLMGDVQIFTLFDNDWTGKRQSIKYKQEFNTIPLLFNEDESKDFTEFLSKFGKDATTDLIEYYKHHLL